MGKRVSPTAGLDGGLRNIDTDEPAAIKMLHPIDESSGATTEVEAPLEALAVRDDVSIQEPLVFFRGKGGVGESIEVDLGRMTSVARVRKIAHLSTRPSVYDPIITNPLF